ncbi:MAG: DUF3108 domain-containing protein [Bdellovibrionota bacterium]|nr:hypothetical protein [Pseudobdellovibrionaceae bacterium]|tara:strand:+ start:19332 stop:20516 length:1185 start_codon:yes stop_codon:yes gene_type:complete
MKLSLKQKFLSFSLSLLLLLLASCATSKDYMKVLDDIYMEEEYDSVIQVEDASKPKEDSAEPNPEKKAESQTADSKKTIESPKKKEEAKAVKANKKAKEKTPKKAIAKKKTDSEKQKPNTSKELPKKTAEDIKKDLLRKSVNAKGRKLPDIEDAEGFVGRRPVVDPFRVGEEVVMAVEYFGVKAGELSLKVLPFKKVNGRKAYHFRSEVRSNSSFSMIYEVDDWSETFVDYETMLPFNYTVHVDHSNEKKQIRSIFEHAENHVKVWEKKIDDDGKVKKKIYEWEMYPFSQNVISVFFYIRNFQLKVGKTIKFPLTDENNNMILEAEVLRKEKLSIPGDKEVEAFVIKPKVSIEGNFKPVGDIFLWLTADERKQIVQVKSALKIGTLKFVPVRLK